MQCEAIVCLNIEIKTNYNGFQKELCVLNLIHDKSTLEIINMRFQTI